MKSNCSFWRCDHIIVIILFGISISACSLTEFWAEMFVNECVNETWYIFAGDNPAPKYPSVIISMCHASSVSDSIINHKERTKVKQIAHYSSHSIRLHFSRITEEIQAKIFRRIYERLMITSIQQRTFRRNAKIYENDYPLYGPMQFKLEFLHSRWNIDVITWFESNAAYALLSFGDREGHLPYSLEKTMNRHKNISDLFEFLLYYRVISGKGHQCKHANRLEKLQSLTANFNAYDRIFCDAFEYYGLPFQGYWNEGDMLYHRARFVRDDIVSHFPPEASKVVYYASPMITFVVLQREPVTWMFMFRPFPISLWSLIIITIAVLKGVQRVARIYGYDLSLVKMQRRFYHAIEFTSGIYRIVIVSAYCGMVLLGILYPLYTWTPDTFSDLNATTNYKVCTSFFAPIKDTHLKVNFKLNGVAEENWIIRDKSSPALYFDTKNPENDSLETAGGDMDGNSSSPTGGKQYFRAALMYDDKMNLWMKGREFLPFTYSIFDNIKPAHDKVLPELRYISVASGATRLHFVLDAIKWGFTCGVWLRYYNLEMNYYKNVAPLIVARMKREAYDGEMYQVEDNKRPLTWNDLYSCFVLAGIGLVIACLAIVLEIFLKGCTEITKPSF